MPNGLRPERWRANLAGAVACITMAVWYFGPRYLGQTYADDAHTLFRLVAIGPNRYFTPAAGNFLTTSALLCFVSCGLWPVAFWIDFNFVSASSVPGLYCSSMKNPAVELDMVPDYTYTFKDPYTTKSGVWNVLPGRTLAPTKIIIDGGDEVWDIVPQKDGSLAIRSRNTRLWLYRGSVRRSRGSR